MSTRFLRSRDAAAYLGIGHTTLNKLRMGGGANGPAFSKLGPKTVVYAIEDLDAWATAQRRGGANDATPAGRAA